MAPRKKAAKKVTAKKAVAKKAAKKVALKKAAKKIPAAPEKDPAMGEKTPEYLTWLKKWHPATYQEKFKNWKGKV